MDSETFEEVMVESSTIEEQKKWISGEFFAAILVYDAIRKDICFHTRKTGLQRPRMNEVCLKPKDQDVLSCVDVGVRTGWP